MHFFRLNTVPHTVQFLFKFFLLDILGLSDLVVTHKPELFLLRQLMERYVLILLLFFFGRWRL